MLGLQSKTQGKTAVIRCPCGTVVSVPTGGRLPCPNGCGALLWPETDRRGDITPVASVPDDYPFPGLPYLVRVC